MEEESKDLPDEVEKLKPIALHECFIPEETSPKFDLSNTVIDFSNTEETPDNEEQSIHKIDAQSNNPTSISLQEFESQVILYLGGNKRGEEVVEEVEEDKDENNSILTQLLSNGVVVVGSSIYYTATDTDPLSILSQEVEYIESEAIPDNILINKNDKINNIPEHLQEISRSNIKAPEGEYTIVWIDHPREPEATCIVFDHKGKKYIGKISTNDDNIQDPNTQPNQFLILKYDKKSNKFVDFKPSEPLPQANEKST